MYTTQTIQQPTTYMEPVQRSIQVPKTVMEPAEIETQVPKYEMEERTIQVSSSALRDLEPEADIRRGSACSGPG